MRGKSFAGSEINFGEFGLKATSCGWVTSRQIESARKTMTHFTQKGGRVWIRIFPDKPVSKKPPETRMGTGKGDIAEYVAVVRPGRILFEMGGLPKEMAFEAITRAADKLPIRTKYIEKVKI
jgi:large subunit ribosomal protein L16